MTTEREQERLIENAEKVINLRFADDLKRRGYGPDYALAVSKEIAAEVVKANLREALDKNHKEELCQQQQ
jgi:hypothetical protein